MTYQLDYSANLFVCHLINILLTELSSSVQENIDWGHEYRPNTVRCTHDLSQDSPIQTNHSSVNKSKVLPSNSVSKRY